MYENSRTGTLSCLLCNLLQCSKAAECPLLPCQARTRFVKCRVRTHDTGGLWKCVLVCVCGSFASLFVYSSVCVCACNMFLHPSTHACVCIWLRVFFCFLTQGLCPLKGVPVSQLRERKTRSEAGRGVRTGTKTREKTRASVGEREPRRGISRNVAPAIGVCCFEPGSRCLCIANIANITGNLLTTSLIPSSLVAPDWLFIQLRHSEKESLVNIIVCLMYNTVSDSSLS